MGFFDEVEPFDECSIGLGYCNLLAEPVEVEVEGSMASSAGLMSEGTGEEGFSATSGASDENVFGTVQPGSISQCGEFVGLLYLSFPINKTSIKTIIKPYSSFEEKSCSYGI